MRIGFEAKRLFLNDRGLGNYARNLLYGLIKYHPNNDYHLYTTKYAEQHINKNLINPDHTTIHTPNGLVASLSTSAWRSLLLGKVSSKDNLDVFHGLAQELPKDIRKSNSKCVVTIHDMIFLQHPEFYKSIDRRIYYNKVNFAVNNADHIVAISEQTKHDILDTFQVSENKISVIYQSCNELFYDKRTTEVLESVKQKWKLPKDYILYVGALNENKNVKVILEALHKLEGKLDIPLVIVGKGDAYKKIMVEYAQKHKLTNRLIFASEIADPTPFELSSFYQLASLFVFPSFYEGFGIPILEARFSDTQVIASNSSCLEEAGGESSLYFDPKNAEELAVLIESCYSENKFMKGNIDQFKNKNSVKQFIDIYKQ